MSHQKCKIFCLLSITDETVAFNLDITQKRLEKQFQLQIIQTSMLGVGWFTIKIKIQNVFRGVCDSE